MCQIWRTANERKLSIIEALSHKFYQCKFYFANAVLLSLPPSTCSVKHSITFAPLVQNHDQVS